MPCVVDRGSVTWVHVEENAAKTHFGQQGKLWDTGNVRELVHRLALMVAGDMSKSSHELQVDNVLGSDWSAKAE